MNILILGITGYLGKQLAHVLADRGEHTIYGVVRPSSDISDLKDIHVNYIINDVDGIGFLLKNVEIDWIINTICIYHTDESLYSGMLNANLMFPLEVLNEAIKHGQTKFMTMGTSLPERFNLYSYTKHKLSEIGEYLSGLEKITFCDLELEMFYGGAYEPNDRFMRQCMLSMSAGTQMKLTSGFQKRDIIHIEDLTGVILCILDDDRIRGYQKLPVGCGEQHSIREIVNYIHERMQSSSEIVFGGVPDRENEPDTIADVCWYKDIGYELKYSFFGGIDKAISDM